jgi:uncharacterized protein involved in exopolysaccharide biosynthesis
MIGTPRWPDPERVTSDDAVAITPFTLARVLIRRWRLVLAVPLMTAVAAGLFALVFREYSARSRFLPHAARGDLARFAGIAAQIGLSVSSDASTESPDFYVDLVSSGEVLRPAVLREYRFALRPDSPDTLYGTYLDLIGVKGDTPEERTQSGIDELRDNVRASSSVKSGLVTLRTTAPWRGLAEALNGAILELLADFDRERRQGGAHAERVFVEQRLALARADLENAEAALARFLDRNKRPESARLGMELERLQRQVALRQQVYAALAQAYEQARIEEVRNTPVITVVDRPEGSARSRRGVVFVALVGLVTGAVVAVGLAFALDYLERQAGSAEMAALRESLSSLPGRRKVAGATT